MTEIKHVDRRGTPWYFTLDCTPVQERIFRRLLHAVQYVGTREELTFTYLVDVEENEAFRDGFEYAILSALREWTNRRNLTQRTEREERSPYYWENL